MVAQALMLGAEAVQAAPQLMDAIKKKYPAQYRKMAELWKRSTGGSSTVIDSAEQAKRNGDSNLAGALLRTALRANLSADQIMSVADRRAQAAMAAHLEMIQQHVLRDIENNDRAVVSNGITDDALSAKAGELRRLQRFTGFTLSQIRELVVFINTTSVAQLDEIERRVAENRGILV